MTETNPKRRWFRFTIRDLLWLIALVGMGLGWRLDHRQIAKQRDKAVAEQASTLEVIRVTTNNLGIFDISTH